MSEGVVLPRHILVVDDDGDVRTLLSDYLEHAGYQATAVPGGRAMRRVLELRRIDLILLDVVMPGDDGLKLCREIRARSQTPILMLTAFHKEVDRRKALEVGANDYMRKPFLEDELIGRVHAMLKRTA